jgi:hypothetical protein
MNMSFWRSWIILWAIMPVFSAFFMMAGYRFMNDTVPIQTHHTWALVFVYFASATIFMISPLIVLGRYVPGYGYREHSIVVMGTIAGWILATVISVTSNAWGGQDSLEKSFRGAVILLKYDPPIRVMDFLTLPWHLLAVQKVIASAVNFSVPVFAICAFAKQTKRFPTVMLFVVLGSVAIGVVDVMFDLIRSRSNGVAELNGRPWTERLATIGSWSVSSVIGASISVIGIGSLMRWPGQNVGKEQITQRHMVASGLRLAAVTTTVLLIPSLSINYTLGPKGSASGFAEIRKSLSPPPKVDVSIGEDVLKFSHVLKAKTYRYPNPNSADIQLSPDGRSIVVLEQVGQKESQLSAYDLTSGDRLASLTAVMKLYARASYAWTRDGQHLLVRSRGEVIENDRSVRHDTKLTLFSLPDYQQVAQWQSAGIVCEHFDIGKTSMAEDAKGDVAILCPNPRAGDDTYPMAVVLSLPNLEVASVRNFLDNEPVTPANLLVEVSGSVFAPLIQQRGQATVVMANMINPEMSVSLDDPYSPERGGGLTLQGFLKDKDAENIVEMRLCGKVDTISNPPKVVSNAALGPAICRTLRYDLRDGSYVGLSDGVETRVPRDNTLPQEFSIEYRDWQITGEVDPLSQTGDLTVTGAEYDLVLQEIESSSQIPVVVSEELGLLMAHRVDTRQIAVYQIAQ